MPMVGARERIQANIQRQQAKNARLKSKTAKQGGYIPPSNAPQLQIDTGIFGTTVSTIGGRRKRKGAGDNSPLSSLGQWVFKKLGLPNG